MKDNPSRFDEDTWAHLDSFFSHLAEPVRLQVWGDAEGSWAEREAAVLAAELAGHFPAISYELLPRRQDYAYYPVIAAMGLQNDEPVDFGVRIIGLPDGYQLTTLVGAIQAVSFRGQQLEPRTRVQLHRLPAAVDIQILTAADDEGGPLMAGMTFGMAVASPLVRTFVIMTDLFPQAAVRYSVTYLPRIIINDRVHVDGVVDEAVMMKQVAAALKSRPT